MNETLKPKLTPEDSAFYAQKFARALFERGGRLVVNVRSGSGMAYRVKPEIYYIDPRTNRVESYNLAYWLAGATKRTLATGWFGDWVKMSGYGYDRAHDTAYEIGTLLETLAPEIFGQYLARGLDLATAHYYEGN